MDNAGGMYGSTDAIAEYKNMLLTDCNVKNYIPSSKISLYECSGLGILNGYSSYRRKKYFLKRGTVNTLVNTVRHIWNLAQLNGILTNVLDRLLIVLCRICI